MRAANVASALTTDVVVLSYGCLFQGGIIYSINDTTSNSSSIGGTVSALEDQAAPDLGSGPQLTSIIWSSNGTNGQGSDDIIPWIAIATASQPQSSVTYNDAKIAFDSTYSNIGTFPFLQESAFLTCNAASDGLCNSANIIEFYNAYTTNFGVGGSPYSLANGPTDINNYAAGLCTKIINAYTDWYLPSICEMDSVTGNAICPPDMQSIVVNLPFLIGDPMTVNPTTSCSQPNAAQCLAGVYWTSTEWSTAAASWAFYEFFNSTSTGGFRTPKSEPYGVRCSRRF